MRSRCATRSAAHRISKKTTVRVRVRVKEKQEDSSKITGNQHTRTKKGKYEREIRSIAFQATILSVGITQKRKGAKVHGNEMQQAIGRDVSDAVRK